MSTDYVCPILGLAYELMCRPMFKKIAPRQRQNSRYFRYPNWKTKSWYKQQTYTKTETCKLYSRVFWISLPNVIDL